MSRISLMFAVLVLILVPALPAAAQRARTAPTLPTWPQTLALANNQQASFLIPVCAVGVVAVHAEWSGAPLSLVISDPKGNAVASLPAKASPIDFEYRVTEADVARGPFWSFALKSPPTMATLSEDKRSAVLTVRGTVSAKYPPFDEAKLRAAMGALQPAQDAALAAMQQRISQLEAAAPAVSGNVIFAPRPERQAFLASQQAQVLTKFQAIVSSPTAMTISPTGVLSAAGLARPTTLPVNAAPSIASLAPTNGSPGDVVTLRCLSLSDPSRASAVFTFGAYTVTAEPAAPPAQDSATLETILKVKVPQAPTVISATTNIQLNLVDQARNLKSQPATFSYDPFPAPIITSVDPAIVRASTTLNVRGSRFQSGDVVHFVIPGLGDVVAAGATCSSEALIMAKVPQFYASEALTGQVYVVNPGGKRSGQVAFTTEVNQLAVTSTYPTAATPGEDIVLSGRLLGSVTSVTYTVRPRSQQAAGTAYIADALFQGGAKPLTIIQKGDAALVVRVGPPQGFSGPLAIDITVNGAGNPVTVPFTVNPDYVTVYYLVPCVNTTFTPGEAWDHWHTKPTVKYPASAWIWASRESGFMWGRWGDDFFCSLPWHLATKYNWSFVKAEFDEGHLWGSAYLNGAGAWPSPVPGPMSDVIWASVHWHCPTMWMAQSAVYYMVSISLRGPAGVPMVIHSDGVQVVIPGQ